MYLKSIRAFGFKSFADKTEIDVKKGITVIVGPNGSGKSNVVDAIKWVLGEQSIKSLRGNSGMTDIIFSGSKSRNPHNRASVSLLFDNSDHYLNSEFDELEIKRVCYRTGENEYYINNTQVRLKDITDIFIDSGAGRESFNIISQGKVSDIINQKPEERRVIVEEAAGVLKYKKRKEETEKKLAKTTDNLERINLIINELNTQIDPLREQAKVAKEYITYKEELQNIEISLIANDINKINTEYEKIKIEADEQRRKIEEIDFSGKKNDTSVEKLKLELIKIDEKIAEKNTSLLEVANELSSVQAEKQMAKERSKYETDDTKLQNNILALKESEINLKKNVEVLKREIDDITEGIKNYEKKLEEKINEIKLLSVQKSKIAIELQNDNKSLFAFNNKKEILEDNIQNDAKMPYAVKAVINNNIKGVHGVLSKLLETDEKYMIAVDTALGANSNVIVVDNENVAKEAVSYLKNNNLGRATFFPLNVITSRYVDADTLEKLKATPDFIDIASNVVTYNQAYKDVIRNQLGNVILTKDIDSMNRLGKLINYRYRIISLDGEVLHQGGSITGGSAKYSNTAFKDKVELEKVNLEIEKLKSNIKVLSEKQEGTSKDFEILESMYNDINRSITISKELLNQKNIKLSEVSQECEKISSEIKGTTGVIQNKVDDYLESILEKFEKLTIKKELLERDLIKLKNEKSDINNEISEKELIIKRNNSEYNNLLNSLKDNEVLIGKYDTKLDNYLNILSEDYSISYEKAFAEYKLELEEKDARSKVQHLKFNIKSLGEVNIGSIKEFERIDKRYSFLVEQRDDLIGGVNNLNEIIESLNKTMENKFAEVFEKINNEFSKVFSELFKGGTGFLKLTNPDNMLETGIDIVAEPPGKKLNLISLLSGGEMTLTAISLLFSVLNIRPVPFAVLDEIEANLDDANVDTFGKYIKNYTGDTQFIIITHKKRTMEYADTLYGITMQESGVSKMVSVKLDNIE